MVKTQGFGPGSCGVFGSLGVTAAKVFAGKFNPKPLGSVLGIALKTVIGLEKHGGYIGPLLVQHIENEKATVGVVKNGLAVGIYPAPLHVHDLIVFEEVFPCFKMALFDLFLRLLDLPIDQLSFDRFVLGNPKSTHDRRSPFAIENAQQIVLKGQVKSA